MISGVLLREARLRAGLSQAELALRAGKATSVIGRWERDEVEPSLETLRELIAAAGLELRFSFAERDESQDDAIGLSHDLTPQQRFARLEAWAEFLADARASVA